LVALHQLFHGHPYENRPIGTLENVARFQRADLDAQLTRLRERRRLVFIAVGNLDPAHVFDQVHKAFGALPEGTYAGDPLPRISFGASSLQSDAMKIPTNYIRSAFPAPRWTDPDFAAGVVTMSALSWRLFEEVRTKRNLSYAPGAGMEISREVGVGVLSVSAVEPTKTEQVMMDEVKRLQNEPMNEKDLNGSKSTFLTGYLMGSDTVDGQARLLEIALIDGGDWKLSRSFAEKVKQVTPADVQAFAKKIVHLQTALVGDASKLDPSILL
jgi:predicted Zn-dependent peptidase